MASPGTQLDHFKLLCDYIKFHLGLFIATPPVFAAVAQVFGVVASKWFLIGWGVMLFTCFVSGAHASWYMGNNLNRSWENWKPDWEKDAGDGFRRFMHHHLYWFGLVAGIAGLLYAIATKP